MCEVFVIGLGVNAWAKRMPSFASAIERRRLNVFVAVAVNVVGAQGVDGDQENVGLGWLFLRLSCPERSGDQPANDQYPSGLHAFQTSITGRGFAAGRGTPLALDSRNDAGQNLELYRFKRYLVMPYPF